MKVSWKQYVGHVSDFAFGALPTGMGLCAIHPAEPGGYGIDVDRLARNPTYVSDREITFSWIRGGFGMLTVRLDLVARRGLVNSSTTERDVSNALAFGTAYRKAVEFAAALEAFCRDFGDEVEWPEGKR